MNSNLFYLVLAGPVLIFCIAMTVRHFAKMYGPDGWRRWLVAKRESGRIFVVMAVVVPVGYLLLNAVLLIPFGGSLFVRLLSAAPMACMFAGLQLISLSRQPTGEKLRCSKCKYAIEGLEAGAPSGREGEHDARCPECGGQWGWRGGSEKASKRWAPGWIALTVVLLMPLAAYFGSIPIMGIMWWNRALMTLVPTPSLVEEMLTAKGFTNDAWAELGRRKVTAEQTARIARHLLVRANTTFYSSDETNWLTRSLKARTIDPSLVRPLLGGLFKVTTRGGTSSDEVFVGIKPNAALFAPFQNYSTVAAPFEVVVAVATADHGEGSENSSVVIPTHGQPLFRTYSLGPVHMEDGGREQRLRGTLSVCLRVMGSQPGAAGGCLYEVVIPIDARLGDAK